MMLYNGVVHFTLHIEHFTLCESCISFAENSYYNEQKTLAFSYKLFQNNLIHSKKY